MIRGQHWSKNYKKTPKELRTLDGHTFDSKREMQIYCDQRNLEVGRVISDLKVHPSFPLTFKDAVRGDVSILTPTGRIMQYRADFSWRENGMLVIADVKGFIAEDSRLKIAVFEAIYGIKVRIIK